MKRQLIIAGTAAALAVGSLSPSILGAQDEAPQSPRDRTLDAQPIPSAPPVPIRPAQATRSQAEAPAVHRFAIDPAHAWVTFSIQRKPATNAHGMFAGISGEIHFHEENLDDSKVIVEVDVNSIMTGVEARDNHLRSDDFFDVEQWPKARFESTAIVHSEGNRYYVSGHFTMMGQTIELTAPFTYQGIQEDARGRTRVGGEATFTIDRSEFGMTYGLATIDAVATVTVSLEGILQEDDD